MTTPKLNPKINYWITSDTHYGHTYVAEQRGFPTVEEHDKFLIDAHNSLVGPNDVVIHLGDVTFHNKAKTQEIFTQLKGHMVFVPGNHDSSRILNRIVDIKHARGLTTTAVWPRLHECKYGDTYLSLCHYPLASWNYSDSRKVQSIHLHGHLHGDAGHHPVAPYVGKGIRHDIGVDTTQFLTPYSLHDLLEKLTTEYQ